MPTVSVVIPTHNRAPLVAGAIKSVLGQTFQDFEIVVVDDASQDDTPEVVAGFQDCRIRYLRNAVSRGDAGARNVGIRSSTAPYIAFLDDDDEWMPEKLAQQIEKFEQSLGEVGAVYAGCLTIDDASGKILGVVLPDKRGDLRDEIFVRNHVTTSSVMIRRECFEQLGLFDENIPYCSDYDMWIRISEKFHFECIRTPLVRYRVHQNKLSMNFGKVIRGQEILLRKYGARLARNRRSFSKYHRDLGLLHTFNGDGHQGRKALSQAIRVFPLDVKNYAIYLLTFLGGEVIEKLAEAKETVFAPLRQVRIEREPGE